MYSTGASIGTVLATDADSTLNGQTQYSVIEAGDSFNFSVEKETGDIKIRNSLHDKVCSPSNPLFTFPTSFLPCPLGLFSLHPTAVAFVHYCFGFFTLTPWAFYPTLVPYHVGPIVPYMLQPTSCSLYFTLPINPLYRTPRKPCAVPRTL